jgi:predicted enzyme related to lactoylglutathione lyase
VDDDELMTIGRFARLTGLTAGTLRHYDEVALLRPASVDAASGYRRYQLRDADRFLEEGIPMPGLPAGCRPCQIKIAVDDVDTAAAFYAAAFGFRLEVIRRTEQADYSSFTFGAYGRDGFFLMVLIAGQDRMDLPGPSTFGLLVDDLDARHAGALKAGAAETVAPHAAEGMPRCSAVRDPSGNWIWLYQA